jgi:hypothetical protein
LGKSGDEEVIIVDIVTPATMESLVDREHRPSVSIYMPAYRSGTETLQGPIRLGNLLDTARDRLTDMGVEDREADALLRAGHRLVADDDFWQHQEGGLALFMAPDLTAWYRLPVEFHENVVVGDSFHVTPLWPIVGGGTLFYVLALSRNEVRLLWADRYRIGDVDLPDDLPTSLAEALWFEDPESQLQHRSSDRTGRGRVVARFHGHGVPEERDEARLVRFLRAVDRGIHDLIDPEDPLVLAGVDEIVGMYRKVSDHRTIVDDFVRGNPDRTALTDLHEPALAAVDPVLRRPREEDAAALGADPDRGAFTVEDVLGAALAGRVAAVFLPEGRHVWGSADAAGGNVDVREEAGADDADLLDLIGVATWTRSGRVHVVDPEDVPGDGTVAAVLRY